MTYDEYKKHLEACGPLDDISKGLLSAFELGYGQGIKDGKTHFTKALAEPEQEAFTLDRGCWERGCCAYDWRDGDGVNISAGRVDEIAKHKHEPVAWLSLCYTEDGDPLGYTAHEQKVYGSFPVYTNPKEDWEAVAADQAMTIAMLRLEKKEWVGITKGEIEEIAKWADKNAAPWYLEYAYAIERKLKEKNT
jgi:hypothetical protein